LGCLVVIDLGKEERVAQRLHGARLGDGLAVLGGDCCRHALTAL